MKVIFTAVATLIILSTTSIAGEVQRVWIPVTGHPSMATITGPRITISRNDHYICPQASDSEKAMIVALATSALTSGLQVEILEANYPKGDLLTPENCLLWIAISK